MFSSLWFLLLLPGLPLGVLILWMLATTKKRERQYRRPFDEMPRPAGYSLQIRTADISEKIHGRSHDVYGRGRRFMDIYD